MKDSDSKAKYLRFISMITTSMVVMFVLMYLNSSRIVDHAWFSETRAYMTLIMGGSMIVVMLAFMLGMYTSPRWNVALFAAGGVRTLADEIIDAQVREIREMEWLIEDISDHGVARNATDAVARSVPDFAANR